MDPQNSGKQPKSKLILVGIVLVVLVVPIVYLTSKTTRKQPDNSAATTEKATVTSSAGLTTVDIDALLAKGVTEQQLEGVKFAFFKYFKQTGKQIQTVNINTKSIKHTIDPNSDNASDFLYFNGSFDGKVPYKAKLNYTTITSVQLYLFDANTGNQLFDSGLVNVGGG